MPVILENNLCKVEKLKSNNFKISFDGEKNKKYLQFIKKNLDVKQEKKNSFVFKAKNVETLKTLLKEKHGKLSYYHCELLFLDMAKTIEHLEDESQGINCIDLDDIIMIEFQDNKNKRQSSYDTKHVTYFFYLNLEHFVELKDLDLSINSPINKSNLFISPEMKQIKHFPTTVKKQSTYYCLALLLCNCFSKISKNMDYDNLVKHLEMIKETKLYWSILRCLEQNPEDRFLLYI